MKNVVKNTFWLIIDRIITLVIGMLVMVNIANHYGPSNYGLYQYALSVNIIIALFLFFLDARIIKKNIASTSEKEKIISNTLYGKVILSGVSLIVGLVFIFITNYSNDFDTILLVLLINNIITSFYFGFQTYFDYNLKSKYITFSNSISSTILIFSVILIVERDYAIVYVAYSLIIANILKLISLTFIYGINVTKFRFYRFDKNILKKLVISSVPLAFAASAATIYSRIDQIMIGAMIDNANVGYYAVSHQLLAVVTLALGPFQVSLFPKLISWYKKDKDLYYKKYQSLTSLSTWIFIAGYIITWLILPKLFFLIFSNDYSSSLKIFSIHIFSALLLYNASLRSTHLTITENTKILMYVQFLSVLINITLNYILINLYGAIGAALATVVTQTISLLISNLVFVNSRKLFIIQLKGFNPLYIRNVFYKGEKYDIK